MKLEQLAQGLVESGGIAKVGRRTEDFCGDGLGIFKTALRVQASVVSAEVRVRGLARETATAASDVAIVAAVRGSVSWHVSSPGMLLKLYGDRNWGTHPGGNAETTEMKRVAEN